jgi:hypothetical protein
MSLDEPPGVGGKVPLDRVLIPGGLAWRTSSTMRRVALVIAVLPVDDDGHATLACAGVEVCSVTSPTS